MTSNSSQPLPLPPTIPVLSRLAVWSVVFGVLSFGLPCCVCQGEWNFRYEPIALCAASAFGWRALLLGWLAWREIDRADGRLYGDEYAAWGVFLGICSLMLLLALGTVDWGASIRIDSKSTVASNNLRNVAIALQNFEAHRGKLPQAGPKATTQQPLLSWRVQILPYLEQDKLYREFHLNEAWNSPHNFQLIARMPYLFRSPYSALRQETGRTCFQLAVGPGTQFDGTLPPHPSSILANPSQTVQLVITDDANAVIWTAPDDYDVRQAPGGLWSYNDKIFVLTHDQRCWPRDPLEQAPLIWQPLLPAGGSSGPKNVANPSGTAGANP